MSTMYRRTTHAIASVLALCALVVSPLAAAHDETVYELRTYHAADGKIEALHERFKHHTINMFAKHGMRSIAYWTPADEPNKLIYILAHKNQASIEGAWKAFVADPEWQKVYAASIADGRLVTKIENVFMTKTDYSP